MPTKLLQALFALCILIGNTNASTHPNITHVSSFCAEEERVKWSNIYKTHFTPRQIEILGNLDSDHPANIRVIESAERTRLLKWDRFQVTNYLSMFSYDLQDFIVDEIATTFESKDVGKIKTLFAHLEIADIDKFYDEASLKLTPEGSKIFDPQSDIFTPYGIKRRTKAKEIEEEYIRRHASSLKARENELQEKEKQLQEKEEQLLAFQASLTEKKEKIRQDKGSIDAKLGTILEESSSIRKMQAELMNQEKELQKKVEDAMRKEQEVHLKLTALIHKEQGLELKQKDLELKEKALQLASAKVEDQKAQQAAADKKLLDGFYMLNYCDSDCDSDDDSSVAQAVPTRKSSSKGSSSKRLKSDLSQAGAGFRSNMCRAHSHDFPDESQDRMIDYAQ